MGINQYNENLDKLFMSPLYQSDVKPKISAICDFCQYEIPTYEDYYWSEEHGKAACTECQEAFLKQFLVEGE